MRLSYKKRIGCTRLIWGPFQEKSKPDEARGNMNKSVKFILILHKYLSYLTHSPFTRQCGKYGELLIMPSDGRWDLTGRLKG